MASKVKDLIKRLQDFDPESDLRVAHNDGYGNPMTCDDFRVTGFPNRGVVYLSPSGNFHDPTEAEDRINVETFEEMEK